jgi:hypothetical protein
MKAKYTVAVGCEDSIPEYYGTYDSSREAIAGGVKFLKEKYNASKEEISTFKKISFVRIGDIYITVNKRDH